MDEQGKSPIPSFSDRRGFRFGLYCTIAAFGTYFCMYAFRKPFAAGTYDGLSFGGINFKILLIISQVAGYTLSKFIGIKVISEMSKSNRIFMLLVLIGIAEFALVGLGVVPYPYNFICMFLNGLPLGMIWGIVFSYLEGRQSTEARAAGATPQQVISALFHDLGHLLVDEHAGEGDFLEEDLNHEEVGAKYLRPFFPAEVIVPIELHVPAKRYLCTVDDSYYNGLSESSKQSFRVQGGKMSDEEKAAFEDTPHLQFACQLRRWDDGGKQGGLEVPDLEAYRDDCIASLL